MLPLEGAVPTRGARLGGSGRRRVGYPLLTRDVRHSSRSKNADSNAAPAPARVAGEKMEPGQRGAAGAGGWEHGARRPPAAASAGRGSLGFIPQVLGLSLWEHYGNGSHPPYQM